jgi:hypothetical protein
MTDPATPATPAASTGGNPFTGILNSILTGLESGIVSVVGFVLAIFMPQLIGLSSQAVTTIGNNFRLFLTAVGNGTPWGTALADMMTADWNEVEGDAKQIGIDFAESVATALEKAGLIPQGK